MPLSDTPDENGRSAYAKSIEETDVEDEASAPSSQLRKMGESEPYPGGLAYSVINLTGKKRLLARNESQPDNVVLTKYRHDTYLCYFIFCAGDIFRPCRVPGRCFVIFKLWCDQHILSSAFSIANDPLGDVDAWLDDVAGPYWIGPRAPPALLIDFDISRDQR